ncbi:MAG: hypothetical protein CMJ89_10005 [Planctomycetes bacterium]|jgi:hypothetical protein|nr:hypothetical protein [Planctomycetota bacterium]
MLLLSLTLLWLAQNEPGPSEPLFAREVLQRHARSGDLVLQGKYRRALQIAQTAWSVEGTVYRLLDDVERFCIDGRVLFTLKNGDQEETEATLWRRGEDWFFLNRTLGEWCRGTGPGLGGRHSAALYGLWALPFADEPERNSFEPDGWKDEGRSHYAGHVCHVIEAKTATGEQQRWFMSEKDGLPCMIRSRRPLDGVETLFEVWSRSDLERRRAPDSRVDPPELKAGSFEEMEAQAVTMAEVFSVREPVSPDVISLSGGLAPFRGRFDAAAGRSRVIGLFGPT